MGFVAFKRNVDGSIPTGVVELQPLLTDPDSGELLVKSTGGGGGGGDASAANQVITNSTLATIAGIEAAMAADIAAIKNTENLESAQLANLSSAATSALQVQQIDLLQLTTSQLSALAPTENGALMVGNAYKKFRDGFVLAFPDLTIWDQSWTNQGSSFVGSGGDTAGSSYLRIALDPLTPETEYVLTSKDTFRLPSRFIFGASMSQRVAGYELALELVGVDESGAVVSISSPADLAISGTVSITTNVATINFDSAHTLKGGDRVVLFGNQESRLNVGPVLVTIVTPLQITVPCTLANGVYNAGGSVRWADPCGLGRNVCGLLYENATVTNGTFTARRNGASPRQLTTTVATTTAVQTNTSPYSDSFNSGNSNELIGTVQDFMIVSRGSDNSSAPSGTNRWTQGIPSEDIGYKIRARTRSLRNVTRPIAKVVSVSKAGSTTWTAVLDRDVSGILTAGRSQIAFSGNGNITNFPNTTSVVVSTVSTNTITFVSTTGTSSNSFGGAVILVQGSVALVGLSGLSVISLARTANILTITVNATATGALPSEWWELYGCAATSLGLYDGPYKILRMTGATYEVASVGANFGTISNTGGMFFKRTEVRLHSIMELEYARLIVEMMNQNGAVDSARALPAAVVSLPTLGAVTTITNAQTSLPVAVADQASAAITTTTTSATITPATGSSYAYDFNYTAVTGTNPTNDVVIQESMDSGTNFFDRYHFPRVTAAGFQRSPLLPLIGNRVRYVQTIGGTTPSFTRVINRTQVSGLGSAIYQYFDRTANVLNGTAAAATPWFLIEGAGILTAKIVAGAITTTGGTYQIQVSDDQTNPVNVGPTVLAVASSTVQTSVTGVLARWARLIVTGAATGQTGTYVSLCAKA